jgi:hypothetical protein
MSGIQRYRSPLPNTTTAVSANHSATFRTVPTLLPIGHRPRPVAVVTVRLDKCLSAVGDDTRGVDASTCFAKGAPSGIVHDT